MQRISISLPDELVVKMKVLIPQPEYNQFFIQLLERELQIREQALYRCACEVETDEVLNSMIKFFFCHFGFDVRRNIEKSY
jgi:hypothetical protein